MLLVLDCPGTQSEGAGKAAACAGCPNQQACSTAPKGPDPGKDTVIANGPFSYFNKWLPVSFLQ